MSAKIINSRRYKTITKTQLERKKRKNNDVLKSQNKSYVRNKSSNTNNSSIISNLRIKKHRERKIEREMLLYSRPQNTVFKEPKQKIYIPKSFVILCCSLVLILLVYISAKIIKLDEMITVNVFNNEEKNEKKVELEPNYNLKIGLTSFNNKDVNTSNNLILNDLYKKVSLSLIKVNNNYEIVYQVARNIEKVSEKEYIITLNDKYKLDIEDIKYSIDKIRLSGKDNVYYDRISYINSVEANDKKSVKITLKEENPYFIYYLDFPIVDKENIILGEYVQTSDENSVVFNRAPKNENKNLSSITIEGYANINESVDAFISNKLDVMFASSNNDMQLIGKKEYNVKKYKDGETLFIFGNKDSKIFSKDEIRRAFMYSLDREEIVKNSDNNFIEVIDLPYLSSSIKYKYDIVGAKNLMDSNGWNRNGYGIYEKKENGQYLNASLKLLVNKDDTDKLNIADNIKNMAKNVGIDIIIEAITSEEINNKINSGDYEIVLATVYLDETPDVRFLKQYLDINSDTSQAFIQVEQSSVEDLEKNVQNLEYVLSDEVACIGIYARNINLVYQKYIYGFDELNYMNIFTNLNNIGKIIE